MNSAHVLLLSAAFAPPMLMFVVMLIAQIQRVTVAKLWKLFTALSAVALLSALTSLMAYLLTDFKLQPTLGDLGTLPIVKWLVVNQLGAWLAVLVQLLGSIIGIFSSRYLQGEARQAQYIGALTGVLSAVHILLLANHWLVLVVAWALVGWALQQLLCFYPERPFAQLAAHKKQIADRVADAFLLVAAGLAWAEVGSGSFSDLWQYLAQHGDSGMLQLSAVCLVLAVVLRTALFPVHGWLIQVMEAPTPVSALLHAGVVNLGGYVLIRFVPLLDAVEPARWLLVCWGLATAFLAGFVMLTRVTIKVRLAWSTVAQMGFMLLECGLGLYTLAAIHLIGHSLYKAHIFLSASSSVHDTKIQMMHSAVIPSRLSMVMAPALALLIVELVQALVVDTVWPWWWRAILALAWAPMLWLPAMRHGELHKMRYNALAGLGIVLSLTVVALLVHVLPLGLHDVPNVSAGIVSLVGMALMYLCLVTLHVYPHGLVSWRRWSYAGFYVDERYTRLALAIWPVNWASGTKSTSTTK